MRKKIYLATAVVAAVCVFNGCMGEDPATGISVEETFTQKATVEGYVYLNTNKSSTEAVKFAPAGTLLSFTIAYQDLGVWESDGKYVKTASVDANGHYSVELPTRADGASVTTTIDGEQILLTVTTDDGKSREQVFRISPETQDISSNFTYLKKLDYTEGAVIQESQAWQEGIYTVKLEYSDGKRKLSVPRDTEVKVTVDKNRFIPARTNDLVFVKKVGANGLLEIKLPAPTLITNDGGLAFTWKSVFVAEGFTKSIIEDGKIVEIYDEYIFTAVPPNYPVIYGGNTVDGGAVNAVRGTQLTFR
ncbi:MAG: hypothetical protein LBJ17_03855 [Dysgonamonadaceae bacterium]|jgi:hypothetical protein|nr:hypothetical protein [Dysgonamonadaceae bacterium]